MPENIKQFVWLVSHGSLPTNCVTRHVSNDASCQRCGAIQETILHALRDCSKARVVWNSFNFTQLQQFDCDDLHGWIKIHAMGAHGILFLVVCWFIWQARNEEVFSDMTWGAWRIQSQIPNLIVSIDKSFGGQAQVKEPRFVTWTPPIDNYVKLNVDGSSLRNPGPSGYGGVIRNKNGLIGFSGYCGITTNLNAKIWLLLKDFILLGEMGTKRSFVNLILKCLLHSLTKECCILILIENIRTLVTRPLKITFCHTLREGNACADWLAKFGANSDVGITSWSSCPQQLSTTLLADAMGVLRIRP